MDKNVPRKRPQPDIDLQSSPSTHSSHSISPSKRSRGGNSKDTQSVLTHRHTQRELSSSAAVTPRKSFSASSDDNDHDGEDDDDDYTSSSGSSLSSSDDSNNESDSDSAREAKTETEPRDQDQIPHITTKQKPHIRPIARDPDLLSRLSAFLPQMKSANESLQREIAAGRAKEIQLDNEDEDHGDDGGQYIEMNLGLGVLEEKRPAEDRSDFGEAEASGDEGDEGCRPSDETGIVDRLMGKKTASSEKPSIQEIAD